MREFFKGTWWHRAAYVFGAAVVILLLDMIIGLGWIPYGIVVVLMVAASYMIMQGEKVTHEIKHSGVFLAGVVLLAGVWVVHPNAWMQPGWAMPGGDVQYVGRTATVVVVRSQGQYIARELDGGKLLWQQKATGPAYVDKYGDLLEQASATSKQADVITVHSGKPGPAAPWTGVPADQPALQPTLPPTAKQLGKWASIGSGDTVLSAVNNGHYAARLVRTKDFTGHWLTRLDTLTHGAPEVWDVRNATRLELHGPVLMLIGNDSTRIVLL